jgi:2-amino-4-hydroxy-6-hydroxymethyldihydropteridine diphosphokinase
VSRRAALAVGANLGDRLAALRSAVDLLRASPGVQVVAVSSVYETDPVGGPDDQPAFLNAVVVLDTDLTAAELLALAHTAERARGRVRAVRWGPRTLDVDVLAVGDEQSDDPMLTLPHPRAHERGFVLLPWAEIDPTFEIVGQGRVGDVAARVDAAGVRRRADLEMAPAR